MGLHGSVADNEALEGDFEMVLWIVAGYCLTAVLFYSYLVATAKPDPTEAGANINTGRSVDEQPVIKRKVA